MNKYIGGFVVCALGLIACNVEHYDCKDDPFDDGDDFGGSIGTGRAGASSISGKSAGGSGASGSGAAAGSNSSGGSSPDGAGGESAGTAGTSPVTQPTPCDEESDCEPGSNCNFEQQQCLPSDEETCGELKTEAACTHRSDCTPIYAGTNCSCGQDCECKGGEPGCVCESFEFFVCEAAN